MKKPRSVTNAVFKVPSVRQVERVVGAPPEKWKGRCHEIAGLIVHNGLIKGHAVYGFYVGYVDPASMFYERKKTAGVVRHGWIYAKDQRGKAFIIDPTRWVFTCESPRIHVTLADSPDYDEGMNRLRAMLLKPAPDPTERVQAPARDFGPMFLPASKLCDEFLTSLLVNGRRKDGRITNMQLFWLANLPYDVLGPFAPEVYRGLKDLKLISYVPIDNQKRAEREGGS